MEFHGIFDVSFQKNVYLKKVITLVHHIILTMESIITEPHLYIKLELTSLLAAP